MPIKLTLAARNALATTLISQIDSGGAAGYVHIYTATQPVGPATAITAQSLLSEHALSYPCGSAANGVLAFSPIQDDNLANATGVAAWARFFTSTGTAVVDASITVIGGGGDLQMNTTNVVINGPIRFTSLNWTMPGG